jgi:DNA-binding transcriptional regulator YiaG
MVMAKSRSRPLTPAEIRAIRLRLGLTIEEAAEKVGVVPTTFRKWELPSQKRTPSPSQAILIRLLEQGKL